MKVVCKTGTTMRQLQVRIPTSKNIQSKIAKIQGCIDLLP